MVRARIAVTRHRWLQLQISFDSKCLNFGFESLYEILRSERFQTKKLVRTECISLLKRKKPGFFSPSKEERKANVETEKNAFSVRNFFSVRAIRISTHYETPQRCLPMFSSLDQNKSDISFIFCFFNGKKIVFVRSKIHSFLHNR